MGRMWVAAGLVVALASGCDEDEAVFVEPQVELGTGSVTWEPLVTDQDLTIGVGVGGGHFFVLHARMRGITPGDPESLAFEDNPTTRFSAYLADDPGQQIHLEIPAYRLGYDEGDGGWFVFRSGRLLILDEGQVFMLYGERVRITVVVADSEGSASDERVVRAVAGP